MLYYLSVSDDKRAPTGGGGQATNNSDAAADGQNEEKSSLTGGDGLGRRGYLKGIGATAVALGGVGIGSAAGPSNSDDWALEFEDDFDGNSLDTSNWGLGWGWGLGAPGSKVSWAKSRHVNVSNSMLRLTASHEDFYDNGEIYVGAIHSKNKVTVEPPVYFEARCNFIKGTGWQNAFWSKPNTEAWPPEVDVVEYLQPSGSTGDHSSHNLHYSGSGVPGDSSTHRTENGSYGGYNSRSDWPGNTFHTYGVEWREGVIRHYVDGQVVEETRDSDILEAFNRGGAEYLMLSLNLDNVGTTDKGMSWDGKEFLCDYVRVYKPDSSSSSDDSTDSSSGDSTEEHYLWARSENGEPVTFAFDAGGGNVRLQSSDTDVDFWVTDDGTTAGGTTSKQSGLPGMWFEGSITDLSYEGPLDLYVDNNSVDPDSLVDTSESGPSEPSSYEHTLEVDGSVSSEITAYSVSASGALGPLKEMNSEDSVSGSTATGEVFEGSDKYGFDGSLTALSADGPIAVRVDGTRLDKFSLTRDSGSGTVDYLVETSGGVQGISPSALNGDEVSGAKIFGSVEGDEDYYWLSSTSVDDVSTFGGSVVTKMNGSVVDRTN